MKMSLMRLGLCRTSGLKRIAAGVLLAWLALVGVPATVGSQLEAAAHAQAVEREQSSIQRRIFACFDRGDYRGAIELIQQHLQQSPGDADMLYNLACAHCRLGEHDAAAQALLQAFKAGFRDIDHMRHDPDLAALREHSIYRKILESADEAAAEQARSSLERWRETYSTAHYRYDTDDRYRIHYATALDATSHREMRAMLERQADQMIKSLFEQPPNDYVLIAIPTPEDADKFFNGNDAAGGMYDHRNRRLVSRDIGGSLRHEFCHAYHFGHMERLGQQHPLWIQEGLASLYEDYEFNGNGTIRFIPNDRQLVIKNRAKAGRLTKWTDIMSMSASEFMDDAKRMYPQVRSMFEYVADQGKLEQWYREYVARFAEDKTGAKAFEVTFGKPLEEIERAWRKWIMDQPAIDLHIRSGDAALGIHSRENTSNDGVLILKVVPNSSAARARMRQGDVIVAVDGQSTRSLVDLRKIIASKQIGDEVEIKARRNGQYYTVRVVLRPLVDEM